VVGLGYADGVLRAASAGDRHAGGAAIIAGTRCPFAGRISMDLVCVDITDLPDGAARRRDLATVIGPEIPIDEFAMSAGTIGYEILTRLGRNRHRVYRGG
jgi:alanine racemase